ncbi:DUF924 family protein [Caballeronia telluris]|uniref:Membrane protein n=1 Tax=Caballeronia telluris TaxID=326475 RepID=A0A158HLC5_9BURK|nr:DUF924 family protein [Caballeronia telluris]SAL45184.1 membrane protein [Caballeronia telluris]
MNGEPLDPRAQEVLDAWFGAPGSPEFGRENKAWFTKNRAFDAALSAHFGALLEEAHAGRLAHWADTPLGALALIVVLDQFSRNCFRGTPRAFAGDATALALAKALVAAGDDVRLPSAQHRNFAYMPFEHDETPESQREAVRLFTALRDETGDVGFLDYAREHAEVIERFGRFPHRNRILGRTMRADEEAWLAKHGGF